MAAQHENAWCVCDTSGGERTLSILPPRHSALVPCSNRNALSAIVRHDTHSHPTKGNTSLSNKLDVGRAGPAPATPVSCCCSPPYDTEGLECYTYAAQRASACAPTSVNWTHAHRHQVPTSPHKSPHVPTRGNKDLEHARHAPGCSVPHNQRRRRLLSFDEPTS